ncbi:MAG TPA: hypothetical protein DEG90_08185 [Porphyromonadaceae bacterium]|nr:hypothetical protein [Porphyromonadaceae bacterium]
MLKRHRGIAKLNRVHYLCVIKQKQESFGLLNLIHTSDDSEVTKIQKPVKLYHIKANWETHQIL